MSFSSSIHSFQSRMYDIVMSITWLLYFLMVFGLSASAPEYLEYVQSGVKLYVSLFLLYRFNPFRHVTFTALDAKITFSAGMFLFVSIVLSSQWGIQLLDSLKQVISSWRG